MDLALNMLYERTVSPSGTNATMVTRTKRGIKQWKTHARAIERLQLKFHPFVRFFILFFLLFFCGNRYHSASGFVRYTPHVSAQVRLLFWNDTASGGERVVFKARST